MDRNMPPIDAETEEFALPSREAALSACREGLARGGPVLVTGAAGVGKTWLGRRLTDDGRFAWASVDAAPGMTPADLLGSIAAALGSSSVPTSAGAARMALGEILDQATADGRPAAMILDEAHLASEELLEEIRLLSNRLGRPDGLAAIVVLGQTSLARRVDTRSLAGLESRLTARVHLLPLDVDEAAAWVGRQAPDRELDLEVVELWHRQAVGNPRRLLRLTLRNFAGMTEPPRYAPRFAAIAPEPVTAGPLANPPPLPRAPHLPEPLVPSKPPLRVEDGLIEVGWDAETESDEDRHDFSAVVAGAETETLDDEPIADHYAALQAWDEWARNQGRGTPRHGARPEVVACGPESEDEVDDMEGASPLDSTPGVWAEDRQPFGPYSQLFSRLKPVKGAD